MDGSSYWSGFEPAVSFPPLKSNIETDICIVGGGLTGLLCAETLLQSGIQNICVLDAGRIGGGDTARSSAMVSFAHDLIYGRLIKKHGEQTARAYWSHHYRGLQKIAEIIAEYNIDCDFEPCDMHLYATTKKGKKTLLKEWDAYRTLGIAAQWTTETDLPFPVLSAIKVSKQGRLNPVKFTAGLCKALSARGVRFYENTRVTDRPDGKRLKVGSHSVSAQNFIIATHYPFLNFPGFYFLKMFQSRSYNVVFETDFPLNGIYEAAEARGFEYRPAGENRILCGGAGTRTGKNKRKGHFVQVEQNIQKAFGEQSKIRARFSAQDCMTFDMLPFAGRYSRFLDNVYVITGFNKWGFTHSAACAKIVAELIGGALKDNPFDPSRVYALKTPVKSLKNLGTIAAGWLDTLFGPDAKKLKRIRPETGAVVWHKGKRLGVYKNRDGSVETINAVCPHLGCGLKWNRDDRSWDCPCHGSRFDTKGNILNNPSYQTAESGDRAARSKHDGVRDGIIDG